MAKLTIPFTKCDAVAANAGTIDTVSSVVGTRSLDKGLYKIAAINVDLLWRLGATNVTQSTGSFLAANDQEIIEVLTDATNISFIYAAHETANGQINIVPVVIREIPGEDLRNY